ncbi:MAG TPA: HsdR family type I site-specific deoxyribonuclease [candidate division WOR-3 bacterium]|uniref:Type I restriction enzyme endonuclease subunit n=1 Tax=candidate division WOR-3 bacterium TaxID=2052148 RepID=A0A9C9K0Z5_UNCW3|nr:HsdR family type I site-specific deoxyribonuclease [candidate division WOR-3 bacterium]
MAKFDEKSLVEDYIIKRLQEKGWWFVPADELDRESYEEPLLISNLIKALVRINEDLNVEDEEVNKVVNELKLTGTGIEGAKKILDFYKFGVPVKFEKDKVVKYIKIFDYEKIENNEFIITRQVYYYGKEHIRTDIILYINGIPLVNIECKDPTRPGGSWFDAYKQIKDYENNVPELYKYIQIGIAVESKAKYFPIIPWLNIEQIKVTEWREENKDSIDSTIEMLLRDRLLDIIRNFLFYRVEYGESTKVITRYMQYRAANKIVNRVLESIGSGESKGSIESRGSEGSRESKGSIESRGSRGSGGSKNRGLIWHWQGSGKTLTMIFAANKLFYAKELENPSIFFIVDRLELEDQLYTEFYSLDITEPEIIGSIEELKDVLSFDDYRGKRGIFVTLIHKFRPEELKDLQQYIEIQVGDKETIVNRHNVIAFIDEGHRTQYGILAAQMKGILKNAFFFAFTGTPISKRGKDTYLEFSYPDKKEFYLDRYFITDSIRDGFTVKIAYQPRLEHLHLKKDMLNAFLEIEQEEIPEDMKSIVEDGLKRRLNVINLFLENPERIKKIAEDIAEHFKKNVDGRFKAMVVTGSRAACVQYEKELSKYFPEDYYEVVLTPQSKRVEVVEYVRETREKYGWKEFRDIVKEKINKFKEEEKPKILIVTNMLLTGFDAPILQVMYLDKPLKEHRLLQAIARTNRPYKGLKEAGIIIDYVGILKEFKRALEMYSTKDIEYALCDFASINKEFIALINELKGLFGECFLNYDRKTLHNAIEIITTRPEVEEEFAGKYRRLRNIFEILGLSETKLEYLNAYKWLSAIYTYYMKVVIRKPSIEPLVQKYYDKTIKYIHKSTEIEKLERSLPIITFDEKFLEKLEEAVKTKEEKAANILFTLQRFVLVEKYKDPVYESLAERVERLVELWREKTKDYEKIYAEGSIIITEIKNLKQRQREFGFSNLEYSILLTFEESLRKDKTLVVKVKELMEEIKEDMFPGWINQVTARKKIARKIRRYIRRFKSEYNLSLEEIDYLYNRIVERVENYGTRGD